MKAKIIGGSVAAVLAASVAIIQPWESPGGDPQLQPYVDLVGVVTVCFGETNVPMRKYTRAECEALLQKDVARRFVALQECIRPPLTVNQYAAVLSIAYNNGTSAICSSTIVKMINRGEPPAVWCQQFDRWVYAGGKKIKGLVNRRAAEKALCLKD